jgi:peptidoglycan-N-acetylglucosamine deacetylase
MLMQWTPSLTIRASAALHVVALASLGTGVPWVWPVGAVLVNHVGLTAAGLWASSQCLGANLACLSPAAYDAAQVAITIDDGPNPTVTPAVLDILDQWKAKATFFCVGQKILAHPELARQIVQRGHCIENHSYNHRHYFSLMAPKALRREISQAQEAISQVVGVKPQFFRAPAGLRNPLLDMVLQEQGLRLVSWTRRGFDTVSHDPDWVLKQLERRLSATDILLLHDGNCAHTADGIPIILDVLPKLLASVQRLNLNTVTLRNAA